MDGSSWMQSAIVALASLAIGGALASSGLKRKARAGAGAAFGLLGLVMSTVAFGSIRDSAASPAGARLVPYLLPLALMLAALDVAGGAARLYASSRAKTLVVSVCAGGLLFVAFEILRAR
jgi:hypothetical protein